MRLSGYIISIFLLLFSFTGMANKTSSKSAAEKDKVAKQQECKKFEENLDGEIFRKCLAKSSDPIALQKCQKENWEQAKKDRRYKRLCE